jgi:hypothetical protein
MAEYEVQQRVAPASASTPRRGSRVHLIVLHSDLGSAFESLTAFTARGSTSARISILPPMARSPSWCRINAPRAIAAGPTGRIASATST